MKQLFIALLLFPVIVLPAQSVRGTVEGAVSDSAGIALPAATVVLMQQKDSVMTSFGVTDDAGHFFIKKVDAGDYILQVSYLGYQTWYRAFSIRPENLKADLGKIQLIQASKLLNTVDIKAQRIPISLRKDTVEYNAAAFKTQPGSVVEDLLKKLPGVQVQSDGTIKAQGETVRNVLVEGKEFFGQDPKIATKNLPADAVDKVQLYNKKSDKAEFTGVEDGQHQKTINLKLKDDKKQGYFGNATGGYGSSDRFEGKFNLNRFAKNTQFFAIGMGNNTSQQGFSFDDYINFMGGLSNLMGGSGGGTGGRVRISFNPQEVGVPLGAGLDNGFTRTWAGGLNFNQNIGSRMEISASYFYNNIRNQMNRTTDRQNLLGDQSFESFETEDRLSQNAGNRLNLTVKEKLDSMQNFIFRGRFNLNDAMLTSNGTSSSYDPGQRLQNTGSRVYNSDGNSVSGNLELIYRRRFNRKGRSLVADLTCQGSNDRRSGNLLAVNDFLLASPSFSQAFHQRQQYFDNADNYGGTLSYTEPLGRKQYLEGQVAHQNYANKTYKDFYDLYDTPTPGEIYNPQLSNHYRRGYQYDRGGLNYVINRPKFNLTAGAAIQQSRLDGTKEESSQAPITRTFNRILPGAFFNYDFKTGRNLNVEYTTSIREPSLEQLLPVVDNSDPLNTFSGNPNLKPEYAHNLIASFMNFDQFSMTSIFVNLSATYTKDQITNASTIDSLFRRNLTPVNVKQDVQFTGYTNFNTPIRFLKATFSLSLNTSFDHGILFVNDVQNNTNRWTNGVEASIENRKKEKFDLTIGARLTQNITQYSISNTLNQSFVKQNYFTDLAVFPSKKWALNTGFSCTVYSKEAFGTQRIVPILKAGITRYILRNNKGQIKLAVSDILNRNIGINRTSQLNYLEEERIKSLGRYVMLSFSYSITGFNKAQDGGIHINMRRD
jgi:hypothetical protein